MDLNSTAGLKSSSLTPDLNIVELPENLRRDAWSDFMADFWRDGRPLVANQELELSVASRQLDGAVFCQINMSPAELVGNNHEFDCFVVRYQNEGNSTAIVNGERTSIRPGSLTVMDLSATRYSIGDQSKITYLAFKKSDLQSAGHQMRPMTHFDSKTSVGRLMLANFHHLANEITHEQDGQASAAVDLFSSLLVNATSDQKALQASDPHTLKAKRIRAEQFIFSHPLSQALDVEQMCTEVGMSRASLYRLFHEDGGLRAYLTNVRLDCAYKVLANSRPARGIVTAVAAQFGFLDLPNFNRSFRRKFGCPPSEILGIAIDESAIEAGTQMHGLYNEPKKANLNAWKSNPFFRDLDELAKKNIGNAMPYANNRFVR
ncbi:AraC family transcriptional regulator [uncultured Roseibium sp.]|uniref:helix-turn-helix domain-containing protein n=1 Tax=uncultured Roseibium sp. TaxID=1936171 RepID=UPI0026187105|nr:AraC family transcriptional regulator [uncultured Roseibium sp.]